MNSKTLRFRPAVRKNRAALSVLVAAASCAVACSSSPGSSGGGTDRVDGQTDFTSAPPGGRSFGGENASDTAGTGTGGGLAGGAPSAANGAPGRAQSTSAAPRKVEETDLYRVEGDRLYYLNGYRGLMIFDISNIDHPRLIGRSAIFGSPVEMVVHNGVATVVVADWYGHMENGLPFHGSIVRGIDATDPDNIKILGEAQLGGWVRDTRVVGEVLYAVSEEYGWAYGWADGLVGLNDGVSVSPGYNQSQVVVSAVSFAGGKIKQTGKINAPGYGGVFNVTPNSIMFAHNVVPPTTNPNQYVQPTQMALDYIDISDPLGTIKLRGEARFPGNLADWGTDNGRWNLDFADGKTAHLLGRDVSQQNNVNGQGFILAIADFTNPDAPVPTSTLSIPGSGWTPAARFDKGRMYLAPSDGYYGGSNNNKTPIEIFDIADPAAPRLAGRTEVPGSVWNFTPSGDGTRLFALGNEGYDPINGVYGSQISLRYIDVSNPLAPVMLGNPATFGQGWAWTPAAGTFKAFTKNDTDGLVVLPFSGWSPDANKYNNGLQLIEFTPSALGNMGTAPTKGWVERGVFAKGSNPNAPTRLLSLSDLSLAVVDYTVHDKPAITYELPLARNVVDVRPSSNGTLAQLSSDWWYENDQDHSNLRVLKIADAEENKSDLAIADVAIEGNNAQVFHNGKLAYVVSSVRHETPCTGGGFSGTGGAEPGAPGKPGVAPKCYSWGQQIQVVDFSGLTPVLRGKKSLPDISQSYWSYGGWYGCYYWDWYGGSEMVQVGGDKLAFRRWIPQYGPSNEYLDAYQSLWIVDLSNPDAPNVASTVVTHDRDGWWGNMRAIGDTLYTTHYEWLSRPTGAGQHNDSEYLVKYYLDRIDLSDPHAPKIGAKINVPGMLVGGSESDPSIIYTIDYRWYNDNHGANEFDVLKLVGDKAYLQSAVGIPGWVGNTFVRGNKAYMSVQEYVEGKNYQQHYMRLWQLDITQPKNIVPSASTADKGWGWLLGVEGDRALVTSGWGGDGIDIYKLSGTAPAFDQTVRTLGWGATSMARQGDQIFLASGHWGVQTVNLK